VLLAAVSRAMPAAGAAMADERAAAQRTRWVMFQM
jgi:hypothetical protein